MKQSNFYQLIYKIMEKQHYEVLDNEGKLQFSMWYIDELKATLDLLSHEEIAWVIETIEKAFLDWKKIFIAWNWWSSATSSHMASDLQKTTLWKQPQTKNDQFKFKAISLSDNIPVMTAWWNDEGYDYIFSEQLKTLWETWDILIIITWSWNSGNLIKAIEVAKENWIKTIWFLWFDWWKAKWMLDQSILVNSTNYWPIEDIHMVLVHLITEYFKKMINK